MYLFILFTLELDIWAGLWATEVVTCLYLQHQEAETRRQRDHDQEKTRIKDS